MVHADLVDTEEVREALGKAIKRAGSQANLALQIGCSKAAISLMWTGRKLMPVVYEGIGFEFVPMFRRVSEKTCDGS